MDALIEHLIEEGFAIRQGQCMIFVRTLRQRELEAERGRITGGTGARFRSTMEGELIVGTAAAGPGVRPLRHDRRWSGVQLGALEPLARTTSRPSGFGHYADYQN